jgi:hypothetical protein
MTVIDERWRIAEKTADDIFYRKRLFSGSRLQMIGRSGPRHCFKRQEETDPGNELDVFVFVFAYVQCTSGIMAVA